MAAVDTINILDVTHLSHSTNTKIWTIDGEGPAYEAVKSYTVMLPAPASKARVVFNNNYDTACSQIHVRVRANLVTAINAAGITKTQNTEPLDWTAIAARAFAHTSDINVASAYEASLQIDCAITGTVAHDGSEIIVQVQNATGLDEWSDLCRFIGPAGTATNIVISTACASGVASLTVANPTAGNFNHLGKFIFIQDATATNCEIAYITSCGADA